MVEKEDKEPSLTSATPPESDSKPPEAEPRSEKEKGTVKLLVALSGLLLVMWGYVLFGATAFLLMEGTGKRTIISQPDIARMQALDKLEELHKHADLAASNKTFRDEARQIFRVYDEIVAKAVSGGWKYNHSIQDEWTYDAAVLFAASLVTTVGYGNIAPVTSPGRLFAIIYSSVGIPLCLVCIGLMGTIMARGFKAMALFLFEDSVTEEGMAYIPIKVSSGVMFTYLFAGAILFRTVGPGWTFLEAFYFCFITLSTIGLGDFVFGEDGGNKDSSFVASVVYLLLGLSLLSMCFNLMQEQAAYKLHLFLSWLRRKLVKVFYCF